MIVKLISNTERPERTVALAGRFTRGDKPFEELEKAVNNLTYCEEFIQRLIQAGHESVLEHASFTFYIDNISRVCSHQLVRHRIASYSQRSQRYGKGSFDFVIPESIAKSERLFERYLGFADVSAYTYYDLCSEGVPPEDARYVLVQGVTTGLIVTMNVRELRHFFNLRLSPDAHWEIRKLARLMLEEVMKVSPSFFEDIYIKFTKEEESNE